MSEKGQEQRKVSITLWPLEANDAALGPGEGAVERDAIWFGEAGKHVRWS